MRYLLACLFCCVLAAQSVYLRDQPGGFVVKGASNATPIEITTYWAHGLVADQVIAIYGVGGNTAANGRFKVKASTGSTTFTLKNADTGADIAGNGAFAATGGWALGGPVSAYSLVDHPRVFLDGPTGELTREIAIDSAAGLTNFVVTTDALCSGSHLVTVNFGFTITTQMAVGKYIGVYNSGTTALNTTGVAAVAKTGTSVGYCSASAVDGTYSPGANAVVSFWAHSQNPAWTRMLTMNAIRYNEVNYGAGSAPHYLGAMLTEWLIDRTKTTYRDKGLSYLQEFEKAGINGSQTFYVSFRESYSNGAYAGGPGTDYALFMMNELGYIYSLLRSYILANWTSDQKTTLYNKLFNDRTEYWGKLNLSGQTSCDREKNRLQTRILAESTAQTNSSSLRTIVLNASDTAADGYYVGDFLLAKYSNGNIHTQPYEIVAYNATTKVATVSSDFYYYLAPNNYYPANQGYIIVPGATIASGVVSCSHCLFQTGNPGAVAIGDIGITNNPFDGGEESPVTVVTSETSLTLANTGRTRGNHVFSAAKKWESGSCGLTWYVSHHVASNYGNPADHPPNGSSERSDMTNTGLGKAWGFYGFLSAFAQDDSRAARLFEWVHMVNYDMYLRFAMDMYAGLSSAGENYHFARNGPMSEGLSMLIQRNVSGFPNINGLWNQSLPWLNIYGYLPWGAGPGYAQNHTAFMAFGEGCGDVFPQLGCSGYWGPITYGLQLHRADPVAGYYKDFMNTRRNIQGDEGVYEDVLRNFLGLSPMITSTDFTALPSQRLLGLASKSECVSLFGSGACWNDAVMGAMASRTGWTNVKDTHLSVLFDPYKGDHTQPEFGVYRINKEGPLVGTGYEKEFTTNLTAYPGGASLGLGASMIGLGTFNGSYPYQEYQRGFELINQSTQVGITSDPTWRTTIARAMPIRWGCGGTCGLSESKVDGDSNSRFTYIALDLKNVWNRQYVPAAYEASARVHRHIAHLKRPGYQELIAIYDDVDAGGSTPIVASTVYPNNGEAWTANESTTYNIGKCAFHGGEALTEGTTSWDSDTKIATSNNGKHGVATQFIAPASSGTIFSPESGPMCTGIERKDATCSAKTGGAPGVKNDKFHGYRVKACYSSNGTDCANSQTFEELVVHRIVQDSTSPTISSSALSPTNWTGLETSDSVVLFSRGGVLRTSVSYTAANAAQHAIIGLAAGSYNITATGASPTTCTVVESDNSCYFTASAGAVSLSQGSAPPVIAESGPISCTDGSACVYALSASGGSAPYVWAQPSGTLPTGASFNTTTHQFEGTPTQTGTWYPTARVTGADGAYSEVTFIYSVAPVGGPDPLAITTTSVAGGEQLVSYSATVAADGGVPPYSFAVTTGSLPAGLSLSSGGAITGTPTTIETQNFTVTVTDSAETPNTDTQDLSITITGPTDLSLSLNFPAVTWGQAVSGVSVATAVGGAAPYTYEATGLPSGITLTSGGTLTGTTYAQPGGYNVTVTATDADDPANTTHVDTTVNVGTTSIGLTLSHVAVGNTTVIVRLGYLGQHAGSACRVWATSGGVLAATFTPSMAYSRQPVILTDLDAGTTYEIRAVCSGRASEPITVTTTNNATTTDVPVVTGSVTGAASISIAWSLDGTPQTAITGSCSTQCTATFPSVTIGSYIVYTVQYLDGGDAQVAIAAPQQLIATAQ